MREVIQDRSHVVKFKGRGFNPRAPVIAYRNLNRAGQWYSVVQGGRVVGHTQFLLLDRPTFHIQEAGRKRAVATGVRNVHAYVRGMINYTWMFFTTHTYNPHGLSQLTHRAGYLPKDGFWVDYKSGALDPFLTPYTMRLPLLAAATALLSKDGLSVNEPDTGPLPP